MFLASRFTILNMSRKTLKKLMHYLMLILCGDVEQNGGPKDMKYQTDDECDEFLRSFESVIDNINQPNRILF